MFNTKTIGIIIGMLFLQACAPLSMGRPFRVNPEIALKPGHDSRGDVISKMGQHFRKSLDSQGREIFTYLWADGKGGGQKCIVLFNKTKPLLSSRVQ